MRDETEWTPWCFGCRCVSLKYQIISTDMVAADAAATKL